MKRDLKKVQQDLLARQAKPVKLRVAAAIAHHELTGKARDAVLARDYFKALSDTAQALAQVTDLYHVNKAGRLLRVPSEDVMQGTFENGGDVLRMPGGTVYQNLSMRRCDVMDGIAALKISRAALERQAGTEKEKS